MAIANVPHGTICKCGEPARPGQRTCKVCHAALMRKVRALKAKNTVVCFAEASCFERFKSGESDELTVTLSRPDDTEIVGVRGKKLVRMSVETVKLTLCKNRKKQ